MYNCINKHYYIAQALLEEAVHLYGFNIDCVIVCSKKKMKEFADISEEKAK